MNKFLKKITQSYQSFSYTHHRNTLLRYKQQWEAVVLPSPTTPIFKKQKHEYI